MSLDLGTLGIVLLIVGIILITINGVQDGKTKVAVGGFIGPIPFGFGNDPGMVKWIVIISAVALVLFIVTQIIK